MFFLISVLGCVATGTQSVIKQNVKLILEDKNYDKALTNLEKAVKTDPKNSELWYWLGVARFQKSTPEATIEAFNKALSLELPISHHAVSYLYLGRSNENLGKFDQAIKDFTKCIQLNPDNTVAIEGRGRVYMNLGQYDQALKDFDFILKGNENHLFALRGKCWAHFRAKEYDQAVQSFTQLIKITPANETSLLYESYGGLGWSYYYQSQFEKARDDFDSAIRMTSPDNILFIKSSTIGKAFCLLGLGDRQTALALIDQAEKYAPSGKNLNFERSLIYYLSGDKSAAWALRGGSGMLGVNLGLNKDVGLTIESVEKDGPASKSGLLKGDVIKAFAGEPIANIIDYERVMAKTNPGKEASIQIIRDGLEKQIRVQIGSAEKLMDSHFLSKPILAAKSVSDPEKDMPSSTLIISPPKEIPLDVSGAGEPSALITNPIKTEPAGIKIDSVGIKPTPVQAGKQFEIIIDLVAKDPGSFQPSIPIVMDYSILQDNKLLKKFKSKEFMVPNGESFMLTRSPNASKIKGSYSLLIELTYNGKRTSKTLSFDIK